MIRPDSGRDHRVGSSDPKQLDCEHMLLLPWDLLFGFSFYAPGTIDALLYDFFTFLLFSIFYLLQKNTNTVISISVLTCQQCPFEKFPSVRGLVTS